MKQSDNRFVVAVFGLPERNYILHLVCFDFVRLQIYKLYF
jgi:hypothetical protein